MFGDKLWLMCPSTALAYTATGLYKTCPLSADDHRLVVVHCVCNVKRLQSIGETVISSAALYWEFCLINTAIWNNVLIQESEGAILHKLML